MWTYDRQYFSEHKVRKLCVIDNGVGMDGEDLRKLMNYMFSSGKQQGVTGNFGIGAKVAGLTHSPNGMVYQVWKEGHGYFGILMKHPENDQYGLRQFETEDGDLEPYLAVEEENNHPSIIVLLQIMGHKLP